MKKHRFMLLSLAIGGFLSLSAQSVTIRPVETPLMVERSRNIVTEICIDNSDGRWNTLEDIRFQLQSQCPASDFKSFELLYTGQTTMLKETSTHWALNHEFKRIGGSQQLYASPRYSILKATALPDKKNQITFTFAHSLLKGKNFFFVSTAMTRMPKLTDTFSLQAEQVRIDKQNVEFTASPSTAKRFGVAVRDHGMDGICAYRIPGMVTSKKGTLLAVYDVRHATWLDLQEDVDVGLSRSIDGGRTWEKMKIIMDMGEYGGLPQSQNGIGDPSILVDEVTGDILVVAVWTHNLKGDRAWTSSGAGFEPHQTAQLMMTRSSDDGRTWSAPVNLTRQVKDESWKFLLQGPGRGITTVDGTLVFPIQYIDSTNVPNAAIMYSRDRGVTWRTHALAKTNTTEAQVVEIEPGVLMLNMRDNNRKGRAVSTTSDWGKTWQTHPTSNKTLIEPVCMASILNVKAKDNVLNRDLLLFSNPNEPQRSKRWKMTIKTSFDKGMTWPDASQLLIDEDHGWGYSCLTMIDPSTVGILYEGSTGHLVFQAIPLKDIVNFKK